MSEQNLTPEQRAFPKSVKRQAYQRFPESCNQVRAILNDAMKQIMAECGIDPAEEATIDSVISQTFQRIRDEVTQPFRTEQMKLLHIIDQRLAGDHDGS